MVMSVFLVNPTAASNLSSHISLIFNINRGSSGLTIVLKLQIKPPHKIAHMAFHNLLDSLLLTTVLQPLQKKKYLTIDLAKSTNIPKFPAR